MTAGTIALTDVLQGLERLLRIYARPRQAPADIRELARDYVEVCGALTPTQFAGAVGAWLRSDNRFFPKPGELYTLGKAQPRGPKGALSLADQYRAWEGHGYRSPVTGTVEPCPVCGAMLDPDPRGDDGRPLRLGVRHDHHRHYDAGIPYSGPRTGPTRGGMMLSARAGSTGDSV